MGKTKKIIMDRIDYSKLIPVDKKFKENNQEASELRQLYNMANNYIISFDWCLSVEKSYLGIGIPGVIGIFLFKIEASIKDIDEFLWIVVGDLPPAYLVVDDSPNPALALDAYICEMSQWVKAVKEGKSIEDLIPVNVNPNIENAKKLESRLKYLDKNILSEYIKDIEDKSVM